MSVKNKRSLLIACCLLLVGGLIYFLSWHDAFLYHQDIAEVTQVTPLSSHKTQDEFKNSDQTHRQEVHLRLLNGKHADKKVTVKNTWSNSGAFDQNFSAGQQVFVDLQKSAHGLTGQISGFKRDTYLLLLCWLVIALLFLTMKFAGLKALFSVIINFCVFIFFVNLDVSLNLNNFFWLFVLSALIFTALSLAIVIGWNKQCVVTFASITAGTALALGIGVLVLKATSSSLHYESLDFATQAPKQLFLSATVIGLLGAVMDAATDIVSTIFELKRAQPQLSVKQLSLSGLSVGRAILGPLVNVLLLIFFAETVPLAVLFFRTGNSIAYTFDWTMTLGVVQSLISGIGIALVIPAASVLAAWSLKKEG
ncbi:membrane protein [Ligilactobacillus salitolerans]|uniref:Membrane protein n=1 Tax=Ligilactobacillus salitolerans TaxID=1808352 RepID=A0A401IS37_9LACO|nr:YibE/F family protein [Ligilactobacillus salitolerans]GBG94350.1 membrane protein [Ligilactobacillus salitolerans]